MIQYVTLQEVEDKKENMNKNEMIKGISCHYINNAIDSDTVILDGIVNGINTFITFEISHI